MKQDSKSTGQGKASAKKKAVRKQANKPGRGGARAGAGRKKTKVGEFVQVHFDMPVNLYTAFDGAGISNKTEYLNELVKTDLVSRGLLTK